MKLLIIHFCRFTITNDDACIVVEMNTLNIVFITDGYAEISGDC